MKILLMELFRDKDIQCKGFFLDGRMENKVRAKRSIMLEWLIEMYNV
jgi:hypothetical protein